MTSLEFLCNGAPTTIAVRDGETLLSVLREGLGLTSVKDGCAPQGQCGCCTVLVDGSPRVACVTPAVRIAGRSVTTIDGLAADVVDPIVERFVDCGASQCGFCTPGIVLRCLDLANANVPPTRVALDRALAAHLCRCTGWQTIDEAISNDPAVRVMAEGRDLVAAAQRSTLEGRTQQTVGPDVVRGHGGFSDDTAPSDAMVFVPKPPHSAADSISAAGHEWVSGESLFEARAAAAKVQGRRTTAPLVAPFGLPDPPPAGVALATSFVEPGYLEPDSSWCAPGGEAASTLGNGGAFGSKIESIATVAARALADTFGHTARVVLAREDVVRIGPKRPPLSATAVLTDGQVHVDVVSALPLIVGPNPYGIDLDVHWTERQVPGPIVSRSVRAPWAESIVLLEGALDAAGFDRAAVVDGLARAVLLDVCIADPDGGLAGAAIDFAEPGDTIERVRIRVAAGALLDRIALRSYCIGAVHMALGWVLSEGLTVDEQGEVHDLTIRSLGIIRPKHMPHVDVEFVDDDRPACAVSDAVFVATAAATWNAVTRHEGTRPVQFPARSTATARAIRK